MAGPPTVLVSMPFMAVDRPSIQLGLLKAIGGAAGFDVRTLHANLDFAARVGPDLYARVADQAGTLVGEWLFSAAAFGAAAPDPDGRSADRFARRLGLGGEPAAVRDRLLRVRRVDVPAYLDALVDGYDWAGVRVVGFTTTFQQNAASFALARRLKARLPGLVTIFGGANFDGDMGVELTRAVECVDLAVIGEADTAFPRVLAALAEGADPGAVPGVARRAGGGAGGHGGPVGAPVAVTPPAPPLRGLDELPPPDYAEYFARAGALGLIEPARRGEVWLPFESARGCWWGAKHHCTFCGLNGGTMQFRAKSAPRVRAELAGQARRYGSFRFEAVDNILDPRYLTELFPALVGDRTDYELFYEVKANLSRDQVRLLAQAGVRRIQPGIESLSSRVLGLMRKGVRAAQNVNLLRWARYYGIDVAWNIIWGFPGETAADYAEQAAVVPHLAHLSPPACADRVCLERFSPLYDDERSFPLRHRAPEPAYARVYPAGVDLDRVAYFFAHEFADALPDDAYAGLGGAVAGWQQAWRRPEPPVLRYWSAPGVLQIYDGRHPGREGTYTFRDTLADIYLACTDRPTTAPAVRDRLGLANPVEEVAAVFGEFGRRGLMFLDGTLALALALPAVPGR